MLPTLRIFLNKFLDSSRRGESERIDALVIIAGDEYAGALGSDSIDELKVHWVQVLKFIHYEVFDSQELDGFEHSRFCIVYALSHDLAG